jgi:hypothetical protein
MGMPFDSDGQRVLLKSVLEYFGMIEEPGTLIELSTVSGEVECEICKVDLTSLPEGVELNLKQQADTS